LLRATLELLAGDFDEAERDSNEAMSIGERMGGETNVLQAHVLQLLILRRERGGLEALEDTVVSCARRFAAIPGWRCALGFLHVMIGRRAEASAALEELCADDFVALPVDGLWLGALALLADIAAALGDAVHAELLYERLLPYGDRNVPLGWVSACTGSASRQLGLLAGLLGRPDAAAAHFEAALAKNGQMGARGWLARTRYEYAQQLVGRDDTRAAAVLDDALSVAAALGMPVLVGQIEAARRRIGAAAR
jgi:tetratricopeptide (TPR) repeat protein